MILETDRLILRGWRDDDAPSLFKYASDERVGPVAGWPPHSDVDYSKAIIRTIFSGKETYAICLKDGGDEPIGSIGLTLKGSPERPLGPREAELGYWVGVPFWGMGIATEAAREMIRHGFEDLKLNLIFAGYFQGNNRSRRVQQKCGFKLHHVNTQSRVLMLSETRIEHINALSFEDWKDKKRQ
jgi:RimJ/RimL family protein N-acetyltransferase